MKTEIEDLLIDYLSGELDDEEMRRISKDLQNSSELRAHLERLRNLQQAVIDLPTVHPSNALHANFEAMLKREKEALARDQKILSISRSKTNRVLWMGIAASIILAIGIFIGRTLEFRSLHQEQMIAMQTELEKTKSNMEQLMQQQSTLNRIKAVSLTYELPEIDEEIIRNLEHLINTDESANVRLAALDALQQMANQPIVKEVLVNALLNQSQPVVQIALINALVELKETAAIPHLENLIENPAILDKVKDEALMGKFKIM